MEGDKIKNWVESEGETGQCLLRESVKFPMISQIFYDELFIQKYEFNSEEILEFRTSQT